MLFHLWYKYNVCGSTALHLYHDPILFHRPAARSVRGHAAVRERAAALAPVRGHDVPV